MRICRAKPSRESTELRFCSGGTNLLLNLSVHEVAPHGIDVANRRSISMDRIFTIQQGMGSRWTRFIIPTALLLLCAAGQGNAQNQATSAPQHVVSTTKEPDQEILKDIENPLADVISLSIQSETNSNIAPYGRVKDVVTIEPILPLNLSTDWILVTRITQPITRQPYDEQKTGRVVGLGDMDPFFLLSPRKLGSLFWGVGPAAYVPTATNDLLGAGKLSLGPSVALAVQPGAWSFGALVSNVWSMAGSVSRPPVNQMSLEYFVSYNLPHDWYLTSAPTITADWRSSPGNVRTVPLGMGIGKLVTIGKAPVDFSGTFYGNAITPAGTSPWSMIFDMTLVLSKSTG